MKRPALYRLAVSKKWMALLAGGVMFEVGGGCDPTVRTTVLSGLQSSAVGLVTSLINAFFLSVQGGASNATGGSSATTQQVVKAVLHVLPNWFA